MMGLNDLTGAQALGLEALVRADLEAPPSRVAEYRAHLIIGLLALPRGDLGALRTHLARAARAGVADLAERAGRGAVTGDPIELELPLLLAIAFGETETREAAAALPREPWFVAEQWHPALPILAGTFDLLRTLAIGRPIELEPLSELRAAAGRLALEDRPYPWIAPMLGGIAAVLSGDRAALEASLNALLALHEETARAGEWRERPEGLLALWPLALDRLARERGLRPGVDSPYLPPGLLG